MSSSTHHRDETGEPALWPLVTAALILVAAADLLVYYGALRLGEALTHDSRPPWALLGPWLLALASAAALVATRSRAPGAPRCCSPRSTPPASATASIRP